MARYFVTFENSTYCEIVARNIRDARKRKFREFSDKGDLSTNPPPKEYDEIEISPVRVSYGGYREEDLPPGDDKIGGGAHHTKIRSRE